MSERAGIGVRNDRYSPAKVSRHLMASHLRTCAVSVSSLLRPPTATPHGDTRLVPKGWCEIDV